MTDDQIIAEYTRSVGHPPENREDDEDWNYRGTKEEIEALKVRLGLVEIEVSDGQMELL